MRAIKAVLRAAGILKQNMPNEDEFVLILRSIIDVNLCKFLSKDAPLFNGIMSDLFPQVTLPKPKNLTIESSIKEACKELNLQFGEYFVLKVLLA